eukprot:1404851-Prorocentrum_lima.AAC.1
MDFVNSLKEEEGTVKEDWMDQEAWGWCERIRKTFRDLRRRKEGRRQWYIALAFRIWAKRQEKA